MMSVPPFAGLGLGLRRQHYRDFLEGTIDVDFVEVISENFMVDGGKPLAVLEAVRQKHDVMLHGVSLSPGSAHGLDRNYLERLRLLAERIEPRWISDHLCWTRSSAHNSHDLLPLPYTAEALDVICTNIQIAQDHLRRPLLLENPSSYLSFPENEMSEWEFLAEVVHRTGSYLLLDVNNIYVSAHNHGYSASDYLAGLPLDRVRQIHLAGHTPGEIAIDTHDRAVCSEVWDLLGEALSLTGPVAIMIELDDAIPPLSELLGELDMARRIAASATREAAAA